MFPQIWSAAFSALLSSHTENIAAFLTVRYILCVLSKPVSVCVCAHCGLRVFRGSSVPKAHFNICKSYGSLESLYNGLIGLRDVSETFVCARETGETVAEVWTCVNGLPAHCNLSP